MSERRNIPGGDPMLLAWFSLLVGLQFFAVLALAFLPFGFDHRSDLGLDYGHFLLLGLVYVILTLVGGGLAISKKEWVWLAGQVFLMVLAIAAVASR